MNTDSAHLILDLWMEGEWSDSWVRKAEEIVDHRFTVVQKNRHVFEPHGETVAFILSESHFTLHSYPEENYISLDIYICRRDYDFLPLIQDIETYLPISRIHHRNIRRGEYALPWLSRWKASEKGLAIATFAVAACSLFYELMLAQTLSAILGDTAHRYNVTIGMYIASMGIGALVYEKLKPQNLRPALIRVEIALAAIGGIAPLASLMWDNLWRDMNGSLASWIISTGLHVMVILIGLLSGLELPLLMDLGEKKRDGFGTSILAIDYAGTLTAAVLFPLVLLPALPLFAISGAVAGLNAFIALLFLGFALKAKEKISIAWLILGGAILALSIYTVLNALEIGDWAVRVFYIGAAS